MRPLIALLLLAGCVAADPPAPDPVVEPAAAPATVPASVAPVPDPLTPVVTDSMAVGPRGQSLPPDTLAALFAATDTSTTGTVAFLHRAGEFPTGAVTARTGERWQGLYPTARGVELRSFPITVEPVADPMAYAPDGELTGRRVSTPFTSAPAESGWTQDAAIALVRRPGDPFPDGPVPTAFVGRWPLETGHLDLVLGEARYQLGIVAGREILFDPPSQKGRPELAVLLSVDGGDPQPISAIRGGGGFPALLWAGDVDGDGALDLLLDESTHYVVGAPALFLSSEARPGALVRRVARHVTTGC